MTTYTVQQMAQAMGVTEKEVQDLMKECGVQPINGCLTEQGLSRLQNYIEKKGDTVNKLENLVKKYTMMVDSCSILHSKFPGLVTELLPLLQKYRKKVVLPATVESELQNKWDTNPNIRPSLQMGWHFLRMLSNNGLLEKRGRQYENKGDFWANDALQCLPQENLLVLTQDNLLARTLECLKVEKDIPESRLKVCFINQYGYLSRHQLRFTDQLIAEDPTPVSVKQMPATGDLVRSEKDGDLRLGRELGSGGEGTVYDLGDGTVAKIYHKDRLTFGKGAKISYMVKHPVKYAGICWPQELLYNQYNELVGYRMPRASGSKLKNLLENRQTLESFCAKGKKKDLVQLAITILKKIAVLQLNGVLLGDINLNNILAVSPTEVWLVDCDSYQTGGYVCPVGDPRFTAPEIQGKKFPTFLRSIGNEQFAVAVLLFMLMVTGKHPYVQQNMESISKAIAEMEFPYYGNHPDVSRKSVRNMAPEGVYLYQWSQLPYFLREDFYNTFQKGGRYSTEDRRLATTIWLQKFKEYFDLLDSGKLQFQDPQADALFPIRGKCTDREERDQALHMICVDCGEEFEITKSEQEYYLSRHLDLPKRCPTCHSLRKKFMNMVSD